jgi:hypothetical protein
MAPSSGPAGSNPMVCPASVSTSTVPGCRTTGPRAATTVAIASEVPRLSRSLSWSATSRQPGPPGAHSGSAVSRPLVRSHGSGAVLA